MEPPVAPAVEPPAVDALAANAPVIAPETNYFGSDGVLSEGWQSTLPEGYRDEPSLKTVKDAKVLAKMFVDTKRMVGKNTIAVPDENSPKDEWSEYYRLGGRPDTVEDYGLAVPEGFPPEFAEQVFPPDRIAKWQQRFFDGGVSKKAAMQFIAEFANDALADIKSASQAEESQLTELTKGLSIDWGAAYDQNIHLGNLAIEEGTMGSAEFKERVVAKVQKDPDLTRLLANLGSKFAEGKSPDFAAIPTPSDLQTQIDELMASPVLTDRNSTPAQRKVITDKIMALRGKMKPEVKTTV
jgi:hypothetical protein